jgi:DNA-binding FrmR family transcriptional regulator
MATDRQDVLRRLASIEGHLKGVRKMIEEETYCVDVLKQTYAVRRAIERLDAALLEGHLSSCVPQGFSEGKGDQVVKELRELFDLAQR